MNTDYQDSMGLKIFSGFICESPVSCAEKAASPPDPVPVYGHDVPANAGAPTGQRKADSFV